MEQIKKIIQDQFPDIRREKIDEISLQMVNPVKTKYHTAIVLTDDFRGNIRGFAILMYMSDLKFCFLDFLAVTPDKPTSGVGGSIYERIREEASSLGTIGIFFECLPDDPALCRDRSFNKQNMKRLAFYERYGAYPIINTSYEKPAKEEDDCAPYPAYDDLGSQRPLKAGELRKIYKAILKRKYSDYCPSDYINMVVNSVKEDPVKVRTPLYVKIQVVESRLIKNSNIKIQLFVNGKHQIHLVREIGYVESPVRVKTIFREISKLGIISEGKVKEYPDRFIYEIHDPDYVKYFKTVCTGLEPGKSVLRRIYRNTSKIIERDSK